jgi:hypothetical protein
VGGFAFLVVYLVVGLLLLVSVELPGEPLGWGWWELTLGRE